MTKLKNNITLLNIASNLILQIVTIISGFIIPRIILTTLGSEVNGLVSSLSQFLNYIAILEGGLSGVILANLYKPLISSEKEKISSIMMTTKNFFKKLSYIFLIYSLFLAIFYPLLTKTSFSYIYIFSLTLILELTLFIQYNFAISYRLLLQADKKVYIVSSTQIIFIILNTLCFVIVSKIYPSIHLLKLLSGLIYIIQPLIFDRIVTKYYDINKKASHDIKLLRSRWDGFAINVASFIHNNTDIAILTFLTDLKTVSIYSVYGLVIAGLKRVIQSISQAIIPTVAHTYARGDREKLKDKFELYEYIMFVVTFFLFITAGLLITPFVMIYTSKVTDANYFQPIYGIIIIIAELMYLIREPYVSIAYAADKFKDIKNAAYIEAILNIILSLILVFKLGLIGVAIGTLVAMTYRTVYHVIYLKNHILKRDIRCFLKKFINFGFIAIIDVSICLILFPIKKYTISNFILYGLIYSIITGILLLINSSILYKDKLKEIKEIII